MINFAAEAVGVHARRVAITREPRDVADGEGALTARDYFVYETYFTDLTSVGLVTGRFRGYASIGGAVDPLWWTVRGSSDGQTAVLSYFNGAGKLLGRIELRRQPDGAWRGVLDGRDPSIPNSGSVSSPIMLVTSEYDFDRVKGDDFFNRPSTISWSAATSTVAAPPQAAASPRT